MQLSTNFSLYELTHSETAERNNIQNEASDITVSRLKELCDTCLQPLRTYYGKSIKITSGFRCLKLNALVSKSPNSSHVYGYAADTKPTDGNMEAYQRAVLSWANQPTFKFDQIILERTNSKGLASWIHIGVRRGTDNSQRRQILYTEDCKHYYPVPKGSKFYKV